MIEILIQKNLIIKEKKAMIINAKNVKNFKKKKFSIKKFIKKLKRIMKMLKSNLKMLIKQFFNKIKRLCN